MKILIAFSLIIMLSGCATLLGTECASTKENPMTQSQIQKCQDDYAKVREEQIHSIRPGNGNL
jgi:uncharacterized protein YceK